MMGFLRYLASIPVYLWYTVGELIIKKLFPKAYEVWFASEIKMIKDIETYLEERERQVQLQLEEMAREFHAGNSAANWEGQTSDLEATSPQWNLFESRLKAKDKEIEAATKAYLDLKRAVLSFLNDPKLAIDSQSILQKMAGIVRSFEVGTRLSAYEPFNTDETGTFAMEGPVVLDNVLSIAEQSKAYKNKNKRNNKNKKNKKRKK